jgi:hypothetical protein
MDPFPLLLLLQFVAPFSESDMNHEIQDNLTIVNEAKILLGHQSVGENVLYGIKELTSTSSGQSLRILRLDECGAESGGFLAGVRIGNNGNPAFKCADFLRITRSFPDRGLDIAAMKFCYADFTRETNVPELFQLYRRTLDSVRSVSPNLLIVHCTVPLTARTSLWKRLAKWILGRPDFSDGGNILRNQYNELLLREYKGEPLFDISTCESTLLDGKRSYFEKDGKVIYTLAPEYSDDGGHLNRLGRKVVAEEFLRVVAQALVSKGQSTIVDSQSPSPKH